MWVLWGTFLYVFATIGEGRHSRRARTISLDDTGFYDDPQRSFQFSSSSKLLYSNKSIIQGHNYGQWKQTEDVTVENNLNSTTFVDQYGVTRRWALSSQADLSPYDHSTVTTQPMLNSSKSKEITITNDPTTNNHGESNGLDQEVVIVQQLSSSLILRENIIRIFTYILKHSESSLNSDLYSSLRLIQKVVIMNRVDILQLLQVIGKMLSFTLIEQLSFVFTELVKLVPRILVSAVNVWVEEIKVNKIKIDKLLHSIEGLMSLSFFSGIDLVNLDNLQMTLGFSQKTIDESTQAVELGIGRTLSLILTAIVDKTLTLTQPLFGVILLNLPKNRIVPHKEETEQFLAKQFRESLVRGFNWNVNITEKGDFYALIRAIFLEIAKSKVTTPIIRNAVLFVLPYISKPSGTFLDSEYYNPLPVISTSTISVIQLLNTIQGNEYPPYVMELRNRLIFYLEHNSIDIQNILKTFTGLNYNKAIDQIIAILTRIAYMSPNVNDNILASVKSLQMALIFKKFNWDVDNGIPKDLIYFPSLIEILNSPTLPSEIRIVSQDLHKIFLSQDIDLSTMMTDNSLKECNRPRNCLFQLLKYAIENKLIKENEAVEDIKFLRPHFSVSGNLITMEIGRSKLPSHINANYFNQLNVTINSNDPYLSVNQNRSLNSLGTFKPDDYQMYDGECYCNVDTTMTKINYEGNTPNKCVLTATPNDTVKALVHPETGTNGTKKVSKKPMTLKGVTTIKAKTTKNGTSKPIEDVKDQAGHGKTTLTNVTTSKPNLPGQVTVKRENNTNAIQSTPKDTTLKSLTTQSIYPTTSKQTPTPQMSVNNQTTLKASTSTQFTTPKPHNDENNVLTPNPAQTTTEIPALGFNSSNQTSAGDLKIEISLVGWNITTMESFPGLSENGSFNISSLFIFLEYVVSSTVLENPNQPGVGNVSILAMQTVKYPEFSCDFLGSSASNNELGSLLPETRPNSPEDRALEPLRLILLIKNLYIRLGQSFKPKRYPTKGILLLAIFKQILEIRLLEDQPHLKMAAINFYIFLLKILSIFSNPRYNESWISLIQVMQLYGNETLEIPIRFLESPPIIDKPVTLLPATEPNENDLYKEMRIILEIKDIYFRLGPDFKPEKYPIKGLLLTAILRQMLKMGLLNDQPHLKIAAFKFYIPLITRFMLPSANGSLYDLINELRPLVEASEFPKITDAFLESPPDTKQPWTLIPPVDDNSPESDVYKQLLWILRIKNLYQLFSPDFQPKNYPTKLLLLTAIFKSIFEHRLLDNQPQYKIIALQFYMFLNKKVAGSNKSGEIGYLNCDVITSNEIISTGLPNEFLDSPVDSDDISKLLIARIPNTIQYIVFKYVDIILKTTSYQLLFGLEFQPKMSPSKGLLLATILDKIQNKGLLYSQVELNVMFGKFFIFLMEKLIHTGSFVVNWKIVISALRPPRNINERKLYSKIESFFLTSPLWKILQLEIKINVRRNIGELLLNIFRYLLTVDQVKKDRELVLALEFYISKIDIYGVGAKPLPIYVKRHKFQVMQTVDLETIFEPLIKSPKIMDSYVKIKLFLGELNKKALKGFNFLSEKTRGPWLKRFLLFLKTIKEATPDVIQNVDTLLNNIRMDGPGLTPVSFPL